MTSDRTHRPRLRRMPDLELLLKELENQGEILEREQIERKAEIDHLRLELEAIRTTLKVLLPEFARRYDTTYDDLLQRFDPEKMSA